MHGYQETALAAMAAAGCAEMVEVCVKDSVIDEAATASNTGILLFFLSPALDIGLGAGIGVGDLALHSCGSSPSYPHIACGKKYASLYEGERGKGRWMMLLIVHNVYVHR